MKTLLNALICLWVVMQCIFTLLFSKEEQRQLDYDNGGGEIQ